MKHLYLVLATLCCISALSCNSSDEEGPRTALPSIRLDEVDASPVSLSFTMTCVQAESAAYALLLANDPLPSASELLATGMQVKVGDSAPITLSGLEENTDYVVAAAARNGEVYSEVATLAISTRAFDVLVAGTRGLGGYYADELTGGANGHYSLNISDIVWENEQAVSAGHQFMFSFHSELAADADHAEPSTGTYTVDVSVSFDKFTIDNRYTSWSATDPSGAGIGSGTLAAGTMTLQKESDGTYRVTARLLTDAEEYCKVTWNGPIEWTNYTTPPFADQRLEAHHALVDYYGTDAVRNPDTDLWSLELYDDLDHATQGLFIRCYTPVAEDPLKPEFPTGSFEVGGEDAAAWTWTPGEILLTEKTGTYLIVMVNGMEQDYYCTGGTIVVSKEDDLYTIACDLTTNYGTRVTGGYTGAIGVKNQFMPPVDEDLTVNCDRVYQDKLYYYSFAGSYNYNFVLCDSQFSEPNVPDNGGPANVVSFDLYTDVAPVDGVPAIPDGTYTVGGMRAGQLSKGFTYGIHYNEKGKQCQKITFTEGTLTVSSTDGIYRLALDCQTGQGCRYVCNFEGALPFGDKDKAGAASMEKQWPEFRPGGLSPFVGGATFGPQVETDFSVRLTGQPAFR